MVKIVACQKKSKRRKRNQKVRGKQVLGMSYDDEEDVISVQQLCLISEYSFSVRDF